MRGWARSYELVVIAGAAGQNFGGGGGGGGGGKGTYTHTHNNHMPKKTAAGGPRGLPRGAAGVSVGLGAD